MRAQGIYGATRAKKRFTTKSDPSAVRAPDLVNRNFTAARPDALWVADFTYCSTWSGIVYVAFIIDVYSRRLVGWKAARSMTASLVIDALNMAAWTRRHTTIDGLICHTDAGSQYTSIAYTERLDDVGAAPPSARSATATTMRWPNRSWGSSRPSCTATPPPWPQRRSLEGPRRPRNRHLRLGVVVQRGAAPLRARRPDAGRVRSRLPSQVSARCGMRKPNQRASVKPRPVHLSWWPFLGEVCELLHAPAGTSGACERRS
jgi:hypothetical protein